MYSNIIHIFTRNCKRQGGLNHVWYDNIIINTNTYFKLTEQTLYKLQMELRENGIIFYTIDKL